MHHSKSLLRSLFAALLLIGTPPLTGYAQQGTLTLPDAVNGGQVALGVTGLGSDEPIALLQLANKGAANLTLTVDEGTVLITGDPSTRNDIVLMAGMVELTPTESNCDAATGPGRVAGGITLAGKETKRACAFGYTLHGPDAQGHPLTNDGPGNYTLGTADAKVVTILRNIRGQGLAGDRNKYREAQLAVWSISGANPPTVDELMRRSIWNDV